jgi:hypothetical protein
MDYSFHFTLFSWDLEDVANRGVQQLVISKTFPIIQSRENPAMKMLDIEQ